MASANSPLWITLIGIGTKAVLLLLLLLSIWSVKIIVERSRSLKRLGEDLSSASQLNQWMEERDQGALEKFAQASGSFSAGAIREILRSAQNADAISHRLTAYLNEQRNTLSGGLAVLATLGSNAPFIGLFGTVLGIIQSFGALATSQTAMNTVIASLAEALAATAVGLFVAIPALTAYNAFSQKIRVAISEAEILRDRYLAQFIFRS